MGLQLLRSACQQKVEQATKQIMWNSIAFKRTKKVSQHQKKWKNRLFHIITTIHTSTLSNGKSIKLLSEWEAVRHQAQPSSMFSLSRLTRWKFDWYLFLLPDGRVANRSRKVLKADVTGKCDDWWALNWISFWFCVMRERSFYRPSTTNYNKLSGSQKHAKNLISRPGTTLRSDCSDDKISQHNVGHIGTNWHQVSYMATPRASLFVILVHDSLQFVTFSSVHKFTQNIHEQFSSYHKLT